MKPWMFYSLVGIGFFIVALFRDSDIAAVAAIVCFCTSAVLEKLEKS